MPNFAQYDAGNLRLQPTEIGIESATLAGRHLSNFYNQWAEGLRDLGNRAGQEFKSSIEAAGNVAVQYAEHKEISEGSAALAGHIVDWTQRWDQLASGNGVDPNDPTIAGKFRDQLDQEMDNFKGAFHTQGGQKWAEEHIDAFRMHMFEKTAADMSTRAGQNAVIQQKQLVNNLSTYVRNSPDEHSLKYAMDTYTSATKSVIEKSPTLRPAEAGQIQTEVLQAGLEQIVKSNAMGYVEKTGMVPDYVRDPQYAKYFKPDEIKQFEQQARMYRRMADSDARSQRVTQDYEARKSFNTEVNSIETALFPTEVGQQPTLKPDSWERLKAAAQLPGAELEPGRIMALYQKFEQITERMNKPEPLGPISHATTVDLLKDIQSGKMTDNRPIFNAYGSDKLNNGDFKFLIDAFNNAQTTDGSLLSKRKHSFLQAIEPQIVGKMNGIDDPTAKEKFYQFAVELDRRIEQARKNGKDPYSPLDPSDPDYMGKPETLRSYMGPLRQNLIDAISAAGGVGARPNVNITGPGKDITGVSVENAPATGFRPPPGWVFSQSRQQYRDPQGNIYDAQGKPVAKSTPTISIPKGQ